MTNGIRISEQGTAPTSAPDAAGAAAGDRPSPPGGTQAGRAADSGWSRSRTLVLYLAAALAVVAVPLVLTRLVDQPEGSVHSFEIPAGTAQRLAAGEAVSVLPADLDIKLRDRLVIVNNDDRAHQVGPFTILPGETLDRRFSEAATFSGYCSLHPSGTFSLDVQVKP